MTERVRDLPPDDRPFTRCGYTCRYVLLDGREVQPIDADDPQLHIRVTAQAPVRRTRFHAIFPVGAFRAMSDDQFMRTIAAMAWQVQNGGDPERIDPCGQTHRLGLREPCGMPRGHGWHHVSAHGASWETDGPTWMSPWPPNHPYHPANKMRCSEEGNDDA
jgi:hypothetical protein